MLVFGRENRFERDSRARAPSRLMCWSSLFVDGCVKKLCETPNSNDSSFPEAKNTSQKHLIEAFTKKKKKKKKKPRIHASQQQPIFFLCAVVFLFPSFVEVRVLDLSFAICVYTRAYVEFCVLGGFPFCNRN